MRTTRVLIAAAFLAAILPANAQERKDSTGPAVYKVEFNIHDGSDAAAKAGRRYTMLIDGTEKGILKAGDRVPVAQGSFQPGVGGSANGLVNTQYTYVDVGVNIDCRVREGSGKFDVIGDVDISSAVQHDRGAAATPPNPTVAQTHISIYAALDPGKTTTVTSIDDPETMRKFSLEVTVTRVN